MDYKQPAIVNTEEEVEVKKDRYESDAEYAQYKRKHFGNINPFSVLDEVDFGYLEDMNEDWIVRAKVNPKENRNIYFK
jgi:hypothetical protein